VGPASLTQQLSDQARTRAQAEDKALQVNDSVEASLAGFIRAEWQMMQRHRNSGNAGWTDRLLAAMRTFKGQYDAVKLAEIDKFGGSRVYARLIAMKCRGATSLLRDVYLAPDRAWGIAPPDDPEIPASIKQSIMQLIQTEIGTMQNAGAQVTPDQIRDRTVQLIEAARDAAKRKARDQANIAEDKIDEILKEGGFYKAVAEFLVDLPIFPFACIKGPIVRILPDVKWTNGKPAAVQIPKLCWQRISPFDVWFTPGVADIEDAAVIERSRITRAELNDCLDLPGYSTTAIQNVLRDYGAGGINTDWDTADAERAVMESRENPHYNRSAMLSMLTFVGNCQGQLLRDWGMAPAKIPDPQRDYYVEAQLIGQYVIKVQLSPSPRKRHPYYITSFEKVPGTPVGNGLPDILEDIQDVSNATLRSLVNNLSISSGPQVVVLEDRLSPGEDGDDLYPWKRWHMTSDPLGQASSVAPVTFFQPNSNAQELLSVYQAFSQMADDLSAIPKYLAGNGAGGAGRTASGLAMLMGNASKVLQTVAANIDRDVYDPLLSNLFDLIMLTDQSGLLTGEEKVQVLGVNVALQKETERSRQLEFLQITANPIDLQIIGPRGRANVLRAVSNTIGLQGEEIVPSDDQLEAQQKAAAEQAAAAGAPGHMQQPPGGPPGGGQPTAQGTTPGPQVTGDMGPRTDLNQQQPNPPVAIGGGP